MKTNRINLTIVALIFVASVFSVQRMKAQSGTKELLGAGATFPYPLYSKMFDVYNNEKGVKINYQSIGSGGGIKQLQNKTVDFGASDAPLSDAEMGQMATPVVHIPTCLGAVMITYNLPGDPKLKLTADVIADIFLGNITRWNDKRITDLNQDVKLPDLAISVIHRSDGSGTTYVFSDYLSKVSPVWNTKPGKGKALDWPVGIGAKGNEGVGGMVKQTPGSVGYVELAYVMQNKMASAEIKNKSGIFVEASIKSISAAAAVTLPEDLRVSLTNTDAKDGYPISSFTYILVYLNQSYDNRTMDKAKETTSLVNWMITDGQKYAAPLIYAPLPKEAAAAAMKQLKKVNFNGKGII
ncbi:MAG: phosphate ABC transporter substrate-binding protein PstS [Bacteroidales bacterium]|jgi:phosphate transport system substrate-binding protein